MRILIVCSRLTGGGAERVAVLWANGFAERGHEVLLISNLFEEQTYQTDNRVKLYNLVSTNNNKIKKWGSAIVNVRNVVKIEHPNVVIGVMDTCSLVSKLATIGMKIPVYMTEHYAFERPQGLSRFERFSRYYLNKLYQGITVLTEADLTVIGNRLRNVYVLPNPLSLEVVTKIPHKGKVILAAGRLDAWYVKGFDILIKSWKKIQDLNDNVNDDDNLKDWWLKIAGDGKQESFKYLMNFLPDGGWKNLNDNDNDDDDDNKSGIWRSEKYHIEFLGFRKDIEELYKKSSIFVLSSRYEGFGLVQIEAMSQGCACIACDYKGRQAEILSPSGDEIRKTKDEKTGIEITENGILCEPDNVEALAKAIKKMIIDNEYRESVRMKAVERSKYYSLENTTARWEGLLDKVVNKQEGRS